MMQAANHARAHALGHALRRFGAVENHFDDAVRRAFLIVRIGPAIMEHRLVQPLVGIVFEQSCDERQAGIWRRDRRLSVIALDRFDHRRGILHGVVFGIDQHRHQRQLGEAGEVILARIRTLQPFKLDALEAQIRANLHRVRRKLRAIETERCVHVGLLIPLMQRIAARVSHGDPEIQFQARRLDRLDIHR